MAAPSANPHNESATHGGATPALSDNSIDFYEAEEDVGSPAGLSDASDAMDPGDESSEVPEEEDSGDDGRPGDREEEQERKEQELQRMQEEMRRQIMDIQRDATLQQTEKARRIQELVSGGYGGKGRSPSKTITNFLQKGDAIDYNMITGEDKQQTFHDKEHGILGCKHYQRGAKLQAHCCGKWFTCRFCHDEVSNHNIVRNLTRTMLCMHCMTTQPAAQDCSNPACRRRVSRYFCPECKLWDDDPRKNIYHCFDCGICRIGKGLGQDYFHCKKCNVCMAISLKGRHKCIERNLESDCPVCGDYMFTSTTTVIFMPCGHCIHYKCHQAYIETSYQCPTCFKSLTNMTEFFRRIDSMLAQHKMPTEYETWVSWVLCNDCEQKSYAKYHFLYHKCASCASYNTRVLKTFEKAIDASTAGAADLEAAEPPAP
ncbi:RING finger and CHY zinc finger domain-containing protein [Hyaloraphidium curvatum]|nr:RING finger and CHY zinc finger domain-containing protein [Hyaloraphidium curvatum]